MKRRQRTGIFWTALLWTALKVLAAPLAATTAADVGGCAGTVPERVLAADPGNYLAQVAGLQPGDLLRLAPGTYTQSLSFFEHHGEENRCIVVEGPGSGAPAVFTGRDCCNTVSITDSSYLVVRDLELDGLGRWGDGVKAEGTSDFAHHVTLENLTIHGHGRDQQVVGISTKCPAWNWVIRGNTIVGAGTGVYLGNSDGEDELSNSLVEYNVIVDTIGYNLQVKHQNGRATAFGAPASGTTILRHNVFSKAENGSTGGAARPNVLVGHLPLAGAGADDDYLIYGNFFYQNPDEGLFQGEGNVILYDNLFRNDFGAAVRIQPHNAVPRRVRVFYNTVVAAGTTVSLSGGDPGFEQRLAGNALFGNPPSGGVQVDNTADAYGAAWSYLENPDGAVAGAVDRLDLTPLAGTLQAPVSTTHLTAFEDASVDFDSRPRAVAFRGAYAGEGPAAWLPALTAKPAPSLFADGFESGSLSAWSSFVH